MTGTEEVTNESGLIDSILSPNSYALTILLAMNRMGKHIYEGTVAPKEVTKRHKANKKARAQRKINRHR